MADLSITAAQVKLLSGIPKQGIGGVAGTAGKVLYEDPADGKLKLADGNVGGAVHRVKGIALNDFAADQPVVYAGEGCVVRLTTGAALGAVALPLWLSATAGGIAPQADLATGMYPTLLGFLSDDGKNIHMALASIDVALG